MSSLKAELIQWHEAVTAYDKEDFNKALELFGGIAESAKINFNIGVILANLEDHEAAVHAYIEALKLDQYFAVAYFQKGVSNFLLRRFEEALEDFNDAYLYLRGNILIDYKQLGLDYKLYSCEVLFNRGLCHAYLDKEEEAAADIAAASNETQTPDHDVVSRALEDGVNGLGVFVMPRGLLYRPPEAKVKNANKVDYLGSSKLIAAVERSEMFIGFKGAHLRKVAQNGEGDAAVSAPPSLQRSATVSGTSDGSSLSLKTYRNNQFTRRALQDVPANSRDERQESPEKAQGTSNLGAGFLEKRAGLRRRATESTSIYRRNVALSPPVTPEIVQPLARANTIAPAMPTCRVTLGGRAPLAPLVTSNLPSSPGDPPAFLYSASAGSENGSSSESPVAGFSPPEAGGSSMLKVKCHYSDTRVVLMDVNATFAQLSERIQQKFGALKPLVLKYKDEDGELVLMTDQEDMDLARGVYLGSSGSGVTKLEVWCFS